MRVGAALLLFVPLSSCVHIAPRPISPSVTAQALESRSLSDERMQQFVTARARTATSPITRWDVDTLTLAAFYFHPDLDVARAQAAVARAAMVTAAQRPNPTLSLPIEHKGREGLSPWVLVFGLDVPVETAGKRGFRVRAASDRARAADLAIAQDAWRVRSVIRAQLASLTAANEASAVLRRQRDIENDLVEALQKRLELGEGTQLELTRARIAAQQTALLLRDREALAAEARARLAVAIGIPESGTDGARFVFDLRQFPAAPDIPDLRRRALLARPDILMSLADYAAAEADLRLELARQYPDLHLAPGFGWDQGSERWDLGVASVLPVFSRNRGPIAEAVARRSVSESRFVALQARIIGSVDETSQQYQSALRKMEDADKIVEMEKRNAEAAKRSFHAGEIDRIALRTAQMEMETARLAQADSLAQAQQALGALEDAVEQPLTGAPVPTVPLSNPREGKR